MASRAALPCTLRQLQYIVAVAELSGFRKAAEACHVSQPALSAQVAQVEAALGVQIFERGQAAVRVAPAGAAIVEQARRVLLAAQDLTEAARLMSDPLRGTVRIGVIPTVCPYLLPEVAPALRRACPRLNVIWSEDKTPSLITALSQGALDGAIVAAGGEVSHLEQLELVRDPFVLAAGPEHRLMRRGTPASPRTLKGERVLLLEDGHCFRDQALALCAATGAGEDSLRATSLSTLVQMVSARQGVTVLPSMAVPIENRRGQLMVRPFARPVPARTLVLAWRRGAALRSALTAVAQTIKDTTGDTAGVGFAES